MRPDRLPLITGLMAWAGSVAVVVGCLWPVWSAWGRAVVAPFGGIDAMLQLGLLEWTARHWTAPETWLNLPIFHPVPGVLGFMDSLLGQAWLVLPLRWMLKPTVAGLYNGAFLGSLLAALGAAAFLWRASGGRWMTAGVFALALVGAPYTQSQIGHLNQLPPPFVLVVLGVLVLALRRRDEGCGHSWHWWLLGAALVLQAAWGWYGFAHALLGVAAVKIWWLAGRIRQGDRAWGLIRSVAATALLPALLTAGAVSLLAQPQLKIGERYEGFTREIVEVRAGSADFQHLLNRGVYRGEPRDWVGRGVQGAERYEGRARQVLNPGWVALALALYGWNRRRELDDSRRAWGVAFLAMGLLGLVLAFGDSVGLPGTERRFPLPLEWLRTVAPPFRAFRGAWRFSWLMVIAVAWWSAVGVAGLQQLKHRFVAPVAVTLLALVSVPMGVPALDVPLDGRLLPAGGHPDGPVVTLPAPADEYSEDLTEALWLTRALETGRPVTGGTTGWVPPEVATLRSRLMNCEVGNEDPARMLAEWRAMGITTVEIALRPGDPRVDYWRQILANEGARSVTPWPQPGYEMYLLP